MIDEPSVMDYGPEHQSTCGVQFNEAVNGGPNFGPGWWRGDALVAGESRGKIYRTKLVKAPAGYIGQDQIIACLSWLTIDQCVTPTGALLVACHGGPADWGNGPNAIGKLFKLTHVEPQTAQPVLAYTTSATELRIAFDQPLPDAALADIQKRTRVTAGWFTREGDSFESFRPGYRAEQMQQQLKPVAIKVKGVTTSEDKRMLILATTPRTNRNAVVEVSAWPREAKPLPGELPQANVLNIAANMSGVSAEWSASAGHAKWSGWLPHIDLAIARSLTAASAEHTRLWELMHLPGKLTLSGQLDLWKMLRPMLQHGSRLDYELPPERVNLRLAGPAGTRVSFDKTTTESTDGIAEIKDLVIVNQKYHAIEIELPTGADSSPLTLTWSTADDARARPVPLRRVLVPWATSEYPPVVDAPMPQLSGGDRAKGELLFKGVCAVCHAVNGEGGQSGPDLSNLVYRDYASVLKDIKDPNGTINPDHVAFNITLKDGSALVGVVIEDRQDKLQLAGLAGPPITVKKADIATMKSSPVSLMPPGLDQALGEQGLKDLMTYLMVPADASVQK